MAESLSNIQVRLNTADKKKFAKILAEVGLDIPTAFRMFVKKVINVGGVPFRAQNMDINGMTEKEVRQLRQAIKESKNPKNLSKPFDNIEDILGYLHDL